MKVSNMFEWLESELSAIGTPRFHVVDGLAEPKLRDAVINSRLRLPRSYVKFVLRFGNAKLYRKSRSGYAIGVFAGPREGRLNDGTYAYQIGYYDSAGIFVRNEVNTSGWPVYERELHTERRVANDFEEWLKTTCERVRSGYGLEKWSEIEHGPAPFSHEEEEIVETRQLIAWRVLGIDSSGNHIFEVTNGGHFVLPVLTVGVRSKDGRLNGALRLKIGHIAPGDTAILHLACYKDIVPSKHIEIFALPSPRPEDRDYYAEFK